MNRFLHGVARAVIEAFELPEPILEIGSYQVTGQEAVANLRDLLPGKNYIGVDMRPGPGVDQVANVEALPWPDASVGSVIALSTFEHVRHFWKGFAEVQRVLRSDGVFFVACPFYFHVHGYPSDYWRFTPQALEVLLEAFPQRILGWHGPERRPANVWGLGFGSRYAPLSPQAFAAYQGLLARHGREPLSWGRKWRYRLGRVLCGRRPFAPHLDRERWQSVLQAARTAA